MAEYVWILGGTSEGRALCEICSAQGIPAVVSVASDYGGELVETLPGVEVRVGKLNAEDMGALIRAGAACVIDATHPYAKNVSRNAQVACEECNVSYFRVLRPETLELGDDVVRVPSAEAAAAYLAENPGHAFLAIGVNQLAPFTELQNFKHRLSVRVLPDRQSLNRLHELGFSADQIFAMKGPFTKELNEAMLRSRGALFLVTKDGGDAGGMQAKYSAAQAAGATMILIERPPEKAIGWSGNVFEAIAFARKKLGMHCHTTPRFPVFLDLSAQLALIVGGGAVAARRAETLLQYCAAVKVIAPEAKRGMPRRVKLEARGYQPGDCRGAAFVVAATDDAALNAAIAEEARALGIPVSCASNGEAGSAFFPATLRQDGVSLGLVSGDPAVSKHLSRALRMQWPTIVNMAIESLRAEDEEKKSGASGRRAGQKRRA